MQSLGYDDHVLVDFLINVDIETDDFLTCIGIETSSYAKKGGFEYVEDVYAIAEKSKSKGEFEARIKKLLDGRVSRMQSLMADAESIMRK